MDSGYFAETVEDTSISLANFANTLIGRFSERPDAAAVVFSISYLRTFSSTNNQKSGNFVGVSHNYANISLTKDYGEVTNNFEDTYSCRTIKNASTPVAHFKTIDKFIDFMRSRLNPNAVNQIRKIGLPKYYVCYWPTESISESYYDSNVEEFSESRSIIKKSLSLAVELNIIEKADAAVLLDGESAKQQASETTTEAQTPRAPITVDESKCDPPTITNFYPQSGVTETIVSVNGSEFNSVTGITFNNIDINVKDYTIFNDISLRFVVPQLTPNNDTEVTITLRGLNGDVSTADKFSYKSIGIINPSSAGPTT